MISVRTVCAASLFFVSVGWMQGQDSSSSPVAGDGSRSIPLRVAVGTPLQIALDKEVRIRKQGQPIHGRLMQPVYAFDHLVIPAGTEALGHISEVKPISGKKRVLAILNVNFTPAHEIGVTFDELVLADGRHIALLTSVAPGSGRVIQLVSAGAGKKSSAVKSAAAQKMDQARQQWRDAMKQVEEPGKVHRAVRYGETQLPVHPQYLEAGTLYFAELQQPLEFGTETVTAADEAKIGTPPPGSLVHALLMTPLNSGTTKMGAEVEAVMSQPLLDANKALLLPQGSVLKGSVLQVRPARRLHHNGQLRIAFHQLVLPDGAVSNVDTTLEGVESGAGEHVKLDTEGGAHATSSSSRYISTGMSVGLALVGSGGRNDVGEAGPVAGGATGFKLVGIVVGLVVRSHNWGILMSAYGGGRAIYTNFLGRGKEISFPKDTAMDVGLGDRAGVAKPMMP